MKTISEIFLVDVFGRPSYQFFKLHGFGNMFYFLHQLRGKVRNPIPLGPLVKPVSSSVMGPMEWVYLPKRCGMQNIDLFVVCLTKPSVARSV